MLNKNNYIGAYLLLSENIINIKLIILYSIIIINLIGFTILFIQPI
jgi:hypothetical protein